MADKCQFCENEMRGKVLHVPLCLNCMLHVRLELDRLIASVKEDNRRCDDKLEITEIEKRYTQGIAVKGSD